jgi:hypothetical protein
MNLRQSLCSIFTGNYFTSEFLCVANDSELHEVKLELVLPTKTNGIDVTESHLLLGAGPVIIGICHSTVKDSSFETAHLNFTFRGKHIGAIQLKKINIPQSWPDEIVLFEGVSAKCYLASPFQKVVQRTGYWIRQKAGKAFLSWEVNKMIQLLYSIPRKISIISVTGDSLLNVFPGDLNGAINESHYTMALRTGGQALNQVIALEKIIICEVSPKFHKQVFAMGKNHVNEMKPEENFNLLKIRSPNLSIPVPEGVTSYHELQLIDVQPQGFYHLLLFKNIGRQGFVEPGYLASVHASYASWRIRNGFSFDYLR